MTKKKKTFAEMKKEVVYKRQEKTLELAADTLKVTTPEDLYPKISIVTPSYNQGQFLEECIESVLGQNYPNLEYIIMDGGSTDTSLEIIKKYKRYLTYWQSQPDNGQYSAINEGFRKTSGEIMAWLNSDDKYHPYALFKVAYVFNKFNTIDWLTGNPSFWDRDGHLQSIEPTLPLWSKSMFLQKAVNNTIQQESTFWRRILWEKTGSGLRVEFNLAADLDLWLRFFRYAQLYSVNAFLGGYRFHSNQKAQLFRKQYSKEANKIVDDENAYYSASGDKSSLPVSHIVEISNEFYHYMNIKGADNILQGYCWHFYRKDLEALKRTAELKGFLSASRLLNTELSYITRVPS